MVEAHRAAQAFYMKQLTAGKGPDETKAREYLANRCIHSDTARRFSLGWAPGGTALVNALTKAGFTADELVQAGVAVRQDGGRVVDRFRRRVMFPIRDTAGRAVAFGGRVLDDSHPKYLNSADSPLFRKGKLLYALDLAKQAIQAERTAVIVEGYTDVIAAHSASVGNVVATLGTAFTEDHLRLLSRFADRVVLVFDADAAGLAAAERGLRYASEYGVPTEGVVASVVDQGKVDVRVAVLPEGKDPADLLGDDPGAFRAAIDESVPLVDFAIERRVARHDVTSLSGRLEAAREALAVVAAIQSLPARQAYMERLATRLNLEPHALEAELARVTPAVEATARSTAPKAQVADGGSHGAGTPFAALLETPEGRAEVRALASSGFAGRICGGVRRGAVLFRSYSSRVGGHRVLAGGRRRARAGRRVRIGPQRKLRVGVLVASRRGRGKARTGLR
jgi:DNA primase